MSLSHPLKRLGWLKIEQKKQKKDSNNCWEFLLMRRSLATYCQNTVTYVIKWAACKCFKVLRQKTAKGKAGVSEFKSHIDLQASLAIFKNFNVIFQSSLLFLQQHHLQLLAETIFHQKNREEVPTVTREPEQKRVTFYDLRPTTVT